MNRGKVLEIVRDGWVNMQPTRREVGRYRVLLVEDGPQLARVLSHFLKKMEFSVVHVSSFDAALTKSLSIPFDVILSDIIVPGQMNFDQFIDRLQRAAINACTPVVIMTAFPKLCADYSREHVVFEKPFQLNALGQSLRKLVRSV